MIHTSAPVHAAQVHMTCGHCKERHSGQTRAQVLLQIKRCSATQQAEREMAQRIAEKAEGARREQEAEEETYRAEMEAEIAAEKAQMVYLEGGWDRTGEYFRDDTIGW